MRLKARVGVLLCAAAILGALAASAKADPYGLCGSPGAPLSGTYNNLTITGNSYVDYGQTLRVKRGLTIAPGACLEAFLASSVSISGGVRVAPGAVFGLGYGGGSYTVNGGVYADHPASLYLGGATINGGFTSVGGGDPYRNFPIKDSTFNGNVSVTGWSGGWIGFLRNTVHGNLTISGNSSATDPDSTEVADNHVFGNLACFGNAPAAQFGDSGGGPNTVTGNALGECASLAS